MHFLIIVFLSDAVKEQIEINHPISEDLAFLYGTIITDGKDSYADGATKNICVFADKEVCIFPLLFNTFFFPILGLICKYEQQKIYIY